MKVCDKCGNEAVERTIIDKKTGAEYDLCRECSVDFEAYMSARKAPEQAEEPEPQETKRRPGRPRKET